MKGTTKAARTARRDLFAELSEGLDALVRRQFGGGGRAEIECHAPEESLMIGEMLGAQTVVSSLGSLGQRVGNARPGIP